ncbi:MAG TPA: hypothetical protein VFX67_07070 [Burkholderiales bacterium]|nr:hypothetical protein [Burkholderiales bacterium]
MKTSLGAALSTAALALSACVAVPVGPDGQLYLYPPGVAPGAIAPGGSMYADPRAPQVPATLPARLYPANDAATHTGIVTGTVTNMMTGKGRFQLQYMGEVLVGEATRTGENRGIASAYGAGGTHMSCEYQMNTPRQGVGTCVFSNGAQYRVHIGT